MTPFDANEFYGLALRVVTRERGEAAYRTGINRLYYTCHLVGTEATAGKGWFRPKGDASDHAGLWRALRDNGQVWCTKLQGLYRLREHADYHTGSATHLPVISCSYCPGDTPVDIPSARPLVDASTWNAAKTIAEDVLPRLRAMLLRRGTKGSP